MGVAVANIVRTFKEFQDMDIDVDTAQDFDAFVQTLPTGVVPLIRALHEVPLRKHCRYRIDAGDGENTLVYSAGRFALHVTGPAARAAVSFEGDFDNRAFLRLYRETGDEAVRELLFNAAVPCCYCINDKCTTFLMAPQRTITLGRKVKKLCAWDPGRHHLKLDVTAANLPACVAIAAMMFEYTQPYPARHADLFADERVTYTLAEKGPFYVVGFVQRHSAISPTDEAFIASLLEQDADGRRKIDLVLDATGQPDGDRYVGAIDNFINGAQYDFLFGVMTDQKPAALPEHVVCRKVRSGEWAVYNSPSGNYRAIWKHFTERFYAAEHKGFDRSRIPFEYYDASGRCFDVHIPVDADMPADSGRVITLQHLPNTRLAGFSSYGEADHPQFQDDRPFNPPDRLRELFPLADKVVQAWVHAQFGKPIRDIQGVALDDYTPIPEGLELIELKGGYWRLAGRRHFNGGGEDWPFDVSLDSRVPLDDCQHPRAFNLYVYNARGGYTEIGVPMRVKGRLTYEVVELPPQRVIGKLEAPPESIVTDEEMRCFDSLPANREQGSHVIAYTIVRPKAGLFHDRPLIKGVLAEPDVDVPQGLSEFWLPGGRYVKITEDVPNGEPGWEIDYLLNTVERDAGCKPDLRGQFVIKQKDFGRYYEWYVPCARP
jgi:predicted transcriptional regulator YdeE